MKKYAPRKYMKYFEPSVIIGGCLHYAPYNLSYYIPGFYVAFVFMHYVRKRYEAWWQKYNYILSTGLNAGIAFSSIIIFFTVMYYPKPINWWGNTISNMGFDSKMKGGSMLVRKHQMVILDPEKGHFRRCIICRNKLQCTI